MKATVSTVMSQEEAIDCAASAYIDMYINKDIIPMTENTLFSLGWNARMQNGWRTAHGC